MVYIILLGFLTFGAIAAFFGYRAHLRDEVSSAYRNTREGNGNPPNVTFQAFVGMGSLYFIVATVLTGICSLTNIDKGHIGVASFGGAIISDVHFSEGFQFTKPWISVTEMDGRRYSFDFSSGGKDSKDETISISADNNPISTDVSFPIMLNNSMAWKVLQKIGDDDRWRSQVAVHARSSVRAAIAKFGWVEATTTRINDVAREMHDIFEAKVVEDLMGMGFTEAEAKATFTILPVNLRKSVPDQKVLDAISNKMAAEQDLERQKTLTKIAEEEAKRRKEEGSGVKQLVDGLPKGIAISDIVAVMNAASDKIRADALAKAVDNDKVTVIVTNGSNVSIPSK